MIITAAGFIDIDFDPIGVDLKHGTGGAELAPGGCAKIAFMQPDFGFDEVTIEDSSNAVFAGEFRMAFIIWTGAGHCRKLDLEIHAVEKTLLRFSLDHKGFFGWVLTDDSTGRARQQDAPVPAVANLGKLRITHRIAEGGAEGCQILRIKKRILRDRLGERKRKLGLGGSGLHPVIKDNRITHVIVANMNWVAMFCFMKLPLMEKV